MTRAAAIQMASGTNLSANLQETGRLIAEAAQAGAGLVVLPENFALMGMHEKDKVALRETDGEGPIQDFLAQQARRHGIWLVGGTVPLACPDAGKIFAGCLVYDDQGQRRARYDKIHLFDVRLPDSEEHYEESQTIMSGDHLVTLDTPFGVLGLAVCYDLRFPELFRGLLDRGAEIIALPAAFTAVTGRAHWEPLVRARAIENQVYVIAAAQGGFHVNGRETHGDSMIVDPWGNVVDRLPRGAGMALGTLDPERQRLIRRSFPSIAHRRLSCDLA
ncbi:carbon-nitrogen hydrolase family protein [Ectothiorhodospira mobilis]|nr:carbon-nitrogen hydrolase family protein [Ectothiorhodospira mobilis]